MRLLSVLALALVLSASVVVADETSTPSPSATPVVCTDEDRAPFDACVAACVLPPQCEKPVVNVEALLAAIAEECPCSSFKIYGKYRSCVNTVIIPMRKFSLIDATAKAAVAAANTACKADIKARKKGKDSKIF